MPPFPREHSHGPEQPQLAPSPLGEKPPAFLTGTPPPSGLVADPTVECDEMALNLGLQALNSGALTPPFPSAGQRQRKPSVETPGWALTGRITSEQRLPSMGPTGDQKQEGDKGRSWESTPIAGGGEDPLGHRGHQRLQQGGLRGKMGDVRPQPRGAKLYGRGTSTEPRGTATEPRGTATEPGLGRNHSVHSISPC